MRIVPLYPPRPTAKAQRITGTIGADADATAEADIPHHAHLISSQVFHRIAGANAASAEATAEVGIRTTSR
jgi:hypothetical protein